MVTRVAVDMTLASDEHNETNSKLRCGNMAVYEGIRGRTQGIIAATVKVVFDICVGKILPGQGARGFMYLAI